MKSSPQSTNEFSDANWQLLGEMELPVGSSAGDLIQSWLAETLGPLNLSAHFFNKICASARLAAERDTGAADELAPDPIHMLIYTPVRRPSNGQTWGFFRMEKKGDTPEGKYNPDHAILFYLYPEGD